MLRSSAKVGDIEVKVSPYFYRNCFHLNLPDKVSINEARLSLMINFVSVHTFYINPSPFISTLTCALELLSTLPATPHYLYFH